MDSRRTLSSICLACGTSFLSRPGRGLYCSRLCFSHALRNAVPRIACPCVICGTIRLCKPSIVADGKGKYCSKACRKIGIATHGETRGRDISPEYRVWASIKTRCLNPQSQQYTNYGERGITICDAWRESFETFLADMGRRPSVAHSIDRIDNDKGYTPQNCRWATTQEQAENKRNTVMLTLHGITKPLMQWARDTGYSYGMLLQRKAKGWTDEEALTRPPRICRKRQH